MKVLIPSKNRTSQLELLLRTIKKYTDYEPYVLYKGTNERYLKGYEIVKELHPEAEFQKESGNFYADFYDFIENAGDEFGLFTDDCIVFRRPTWPVKVEEHCFCFSLRLGYNTIVQDYKSGHRQRKLEPDIQTWGAKGDDDILYWDWKKYNKSENYGFPFSWDGCFYNRDKFLSVLNGTSFKDTDNQWAIPLQIIENWVNNKGKITGYLGCFSNSSVVCQNINDTHGYSQPGLRFGMSVEKLNEYLLVGKVIDFDSMDFSKVNACHMEIPFTMKDLK